MAFKSNTENYQRIRSFILGDAWLIDSDRESDEEGDTSGADSDEDTLDASPATEPGLRPQESNRQDARRQQRQWRRSAGLQADGPRRHGRYRTQSNGGMRAKGRAAVIEEGNPAVGETASEIVLYAQ
jgi:hypothetical protein